MEHVVKKFEDVPDVHLLGIGTSMGANLMLRVAGEQKDKFPLEAMVSLNNPFDVWLAINLMRNTPYEGYFSQEIRREMIFKEKTEGEKGIYEQLAERFSLNYEELRRAHSWKQVDEMFTMKVYPQYKTAAEYYYQVSCLPKVKHITKPTLVIHSRDDPIVSVECLPVDECIANKNIIVGISSKGGHVCYFQGFTGQKRWYPLISSEYLEAVIQYKEEQRRKEGCEERLKQGGANIRNREGGLVV